MDTSLKSKVTSLTPELQQAYAAQRAAFERDRYPSCRERLDRLNRLYAMTERIAPALVQAISEDFGHRSAHVTRLADVITVLGAIKHTRRKLPRWMKTRWVPTTLAYLPGRSRIMPQPLGVVGIVAPWNYPYQLAIGPAIAALAAGNRVMIKPSELTPRFAELLRAAVAECFAPDEMTVVTGDAEVGQDFVALPFDHLLFTGSTEVGRQVALAAAANLTPVTLELGGKSPAIFNPDCHLRRDVARLTMGKLLNAGQTCIAPDYVALPRAMLDEFVHEMRACVQRMYPDFAGNPDYTSIVSERHYQRLHGLLDDARAKGARIVPLAGGSHAQAPRKLAPTLVLDVDDSMHIMQQEIFGPLLPVLLYDSIDEVIAYVNRHERPLALYWFGRDAQVRERVLRQTIAGGVTINDCLCHFGQEDLPFGGVGASGMGSYHGESGFRTFSQYKPVFHQSALSGVPLMYPPYGQAFEKMAKLLRLIS